MSGLFDLIGTLKLDAEIALTDPRVQQFMRDAGIKVEQVKAEEKKRKQKSNLLLWGGAAVVVAFLAFRKR
jgi:hypothetical protein